MSTTSLAVAEKKLVPLSEMSSVAISGLGGLSEGIESLDEEEDRVSSFNGPRSHVKQFKKGDPTPGAWDFDATSLASGKGEISFVCNLLVSANVSDFLGLSRDVMVLFLSDVMDGYGDQTPYHSFRHAVNVTQWACLMAERLGDSIEMEEVCALVLSALMIDIGHTGTNNDYHLRTKSEIANVYNFKQPLEKLHHAKGLQIVNKHSILRNLSKGQKDIVLANFRSAILESGLQTHRQQKAKIQELVNKPHAQAQSFREWSKHLSRSERQDVVSFLLHCSDISDHCKSFRHSKWWSEQAMKEMTNQAKLEVDNGLLPSPNMNPNSASLCDNQLGFLDFVVLPDYQILNELVPEYSEQLRNASTNRLEWAEAKKKEKIKPAISLPGSPRQRQRTVPMGRRVSRLPMQMMGRNSFKRPGKNSFQPMGGLGGLSEDGAGDGGSASRKSSNESTKSGALERRVSTEGIPFLVTGPIGECETMQTLTNYDKLKLGMMHNLQKDATAKSATLKKELAGPASAEKAPRVTFKTSDAPVNRRGSVSMQFMNAARTSLAHLSKDRIKDLSHRVSRRSSIIGQLAPKDNKVAPAGGSQRQIKQSELNRQQKVLAGIRSNVFIKKSMAAIDSTSGTFFILIITIYALFGEDLKLYAVDKEFDQTFNNLNIIVLAIFIVELLITCLGKEKYLFSIHFVLDFVAAFSIAFDISEIAPLIMPLFGSDAPPTEVIAETPSGLGEGGGTLENIDQARNARVVRMMRLVRLFRLFRVAKVIKKLQTFSNSKTQAAKAMVNEKLERLVTDVSEDELMVKFHEIDEHSNGCLPPSAVEQFLLETVYPNEKGAAISIAMSEFMRKFDENGDGTVSAQEFKEGFAKLRYEVEENKAMENDTTPSSVGKHFIEKISILVIMIILGLLLIIPMLDWDYHLDFLVPHQLDSSGLNLLHVYAGQETRDEKTMGVLVQEFATKTFPIYMELQGVEPTTLRGWTDKANVNWETIAQIKGKYRRTEINEMMVLSQNCGEGLSSFCVTRAVYDMKSEAQDQASKSLIQTVVVMLLLMGFTFSLNHSAQKTMLGPIERMTQLVQRLASDPLARLSTTQQSSGAAGYETHLLESTLTKIASLVQIGFGSAGAAIIKQNMNAGEFDPMIRGRKIYGVFGFCDIRRFTDATECLKEEVMVFTNKIGRIVHNCCHDFHGSANKNIGDAFLLVWKIPTDTEEEKKVVRLLGALPSHLTGGHTENDTEKDKGAIVLAKKVARTVSANIQWSCDGVPTMADNALMAFMKCLVDIRNSPDLEVYRDDPLLMNRFDYPYTVQMGYGLHVGWAIEGAIGSLHKIDASYLAPDVNMSSRLEAATKQFGVPLLMSHSFTNMLSPSIRKYSRCIDCVTVKGSEEPLGLFTCDVTNSRILNFFGENAEEDFQLCQEGLPKSFMATFKAGLDLYFSGDWQAAHDKLTHAKKMKADDGPIETLLKVMSSHNYIAPEDWKGYRQLTEK